jgi:hypothetical protein
MRIIVGALLLMLVVPLSAEARQQVPPAFGFNFDGTPVINPKTGRPYANIADTEPAAGSAVRTLSMPAAPVAGPAIDPNTTMSLVLQQVEPKTGAITFSVQIPARNAFYPVGNLSIPYTCANIRRVIAVNRQPGNNELYDFGYRLAVRLFPKGTPAQIEALTTSFAQSGERAFTAAEAACVKQNLIPAL